MKKIYPRAPLDLLRYGITSAFGLLFWVPVTGLAQSAPAVVALSPSRNAVAVPRPVPVAATFSQVLSAASVTRSSVRVFSEQRGGQLSGAYTGGGTAALSFSPTQPFKAGETVRTSFTRSLQSTTGTPLNQPVVSQFTANAAPATGTFTTTRPEVIQGVGLTGVVAADFDGDGILDLVTANRGGLLYYAFGDGTGLFSASNVGLGFGTTPGSVTAADLNGDGTLEVLVPKVRTTTVDVATNNGTGRTGFGFGNAITVDNDARQVATADIDGDGDLDVLVTCYSGTVAIRFNNGQGVFSGTTSVPLNTAYGIATGDLDNDGDVDFIASDYSNGLVGVLLNNGQGVFTAGPNIAVGGGPDRVALGDANGDGFLDVFSANLSGGTVSIALNSGTGTFGAAGAVAVPNPAELALGDVDGDGDLDFVVSNYVAGGGVSIRLNNGQGVFSGTGNINLAGNPFGVALADIDNNGTLDLLAAESNGVSQVTVRLNTFAPAVLTSSVTAVCTGINAGTLTLTRPYGTIVKYQVDTGMGFQDVSGTNTGAALAFSNLTATSTYRAVLLTPEGNTVFSASATVIVNPLPVAAITASGPVVFCQGGSVRLTASGGASYRWNTGATTASITVSAGGSYSVTATSAAGCAATSTAVSVTVNPATTATFAYPGSAFCLGSPNSLPTVTGTAGGTFTSTPGIVLNTATGEIDLTASAPGAYAVTYTVSGPCPSSAAAAVTLSAAPVATFSYVPTAGGAGGQAIVTPTLAPGTTAGTFTSGTGLTLNATTGAITLSSSIAGTYAVTNTVPAAGACAPGTATATFTVTPRPAPPVLTASFNGSITTLTSSAATGNQFYFNNALIPGATNQTYVVNGTPAQLGPYTVITTDAFGAVSFPSAAIMVTSATKPLVGTSLQVYPNPTPDGVLLVALTGYLHPAKLKLLNVLGQTVLTVIVPASGGTSTRSLDLTKLSTGVYTLQVTTEGGLDTRRIVKQ
jgi:hypothetical protein